MILTKHEFLQRFTTEEKAAILTAADSSPLVKVYLFDLNAAQEIDICLPETVEGVNALEQAGILPAGRAAEILSQAVSDGVHHLTLVSGTTFKCSSCGQEIVLNTDGTAPAVDGNGNPPANVEEWIGICNG